MPVSVVSLVPRFNPIGLADCNSAAFTQSCGEPIDKLRSDSPAWGVILSWVREYPPRDCIHGCTAGARFFMQKHSALHSPASNFVKPKSLFNTSKSYREPLWGWCKSLPNCHCLPLSLNWLKLTRILKLTRAVFKFCYTYKTEFLWHAFSSCPVRKRASKKFVFLGALRGSLSWNWPQVLGGR